MSDKVQVKGTVNIWVYDTKRELLLHDVQSNLVVTLGKKSLAHLLGGATNGVTKIQAGTNATATALTDTTITGGSLPVNIVSSVYPLDGSIMFNFTFGTGDANGITIVEFGLLTADGVLFSRITRAGIVKTSAISVVGTWQIDF